MLRYSDIDTCSISAVISLTIDDENGVLQIVPHFHLYMYIHSLNYEEIIDIIAIII